MPTRRTPLVLLATSALGLAGCGGGESPPPAPPPSPAQVSPTPGMPAAKSVTVKMKDIQFMPKEVRVAAGGTVTWDNTDSPPHDVTKTTGPGDKFASGTLQPGQKFKQTFKGPGRIEYVCTIHPGMTGTIVVE